MEALPVFVHVLPDHIYSPFHTDLYDEESGSYIIKKSSCIYLNFLVMCQWDHVISAFLLQHNVLVTSNFRTHMFLCMKQDNL